MPKAIVIGGSAGIGKAVAQVLLAKGWQVIGVARRQQPEDVAFTSYIAADLSLMRNAQDLPEKLAKDLMEADLLIFTNGIISANVREETEEKVEMDMAVSYLSRFAFMQAAMKYLPQKTCRIFVWGFPGHNQAATLDDFNSETKYEMWQAHMNTVVGNEALVYYLAEKGFRAVGFEPGLIQTDIRANYLKKGSWCFTVAETLIGWFFWSADQYVKATVVPLIDQSGDGVCYGNTGKQLSKNPFLTEQNQKLIIEASQALLKSALTQKN